MELKENFNKKVIGLRDKKVKLLEELRTIDSELAVLHEFLPPEEYSIRLKIPEMAPEEIPER
ncbi:unnamed protein product [Protopolystoma xenopodis]|uniref:Uncharacterized protein n=1 Tax=Protopolystoma xenopodis TaxID=117903 RepID=A0A448WPZ8_9PLAT|nr:unnamed protein product [Protopolystoma xenopodis]